MWKKFHTKICALHKLDMRRKHAQEWRIIMNSGKKAIKNQGAQGKNAKKKNANESKTPVFAIIVIAAVVLFLCVGVGVEQLKPQTVVTINGDKISLSDMSYRIWQAEQSGNSMEQFYQAYMNSSYWDAASQADAAKTNRDIIKAQVVAEEQEMQILYAEAKKADNASDFDLTEEEEKDIDKEVKSILDKYTTVNRLRLGFSKSYLKKQMEMQKIADKYKESVIEGFGIKEDEVTKDISKTEYREYDIDYYMVPLTEKGDNGDSKDVSADKKKELKKQMEDLQKKAKDAEDFAKLLEDSDTSGITHSSAQIVEKDGWTYLSDDQIKDVKKMKNDEISDVIEDKENKYLFLIKMTDNNSTEAYDSACEEAVQTEKDNKYKEYLESISADYKLEVNNDVWDDVVMGTVTTGVEQVEATAAPKTSEDEKSEDENDDGKDDEDASSSKDSDEKSDDKTGADDTKDSGDAQ